MGQVRTTKDEGKKSARGKHPNSLANLKKGAWPVGVSGNPAGRPEGTKDRSTIIRKWVEAPTEVTNPVTKTKEAGTVEDLIVIGQVSKAIKGDTGAFRELMDSIYGKLKEKTEHSLDLSNLSDEELTTFAAILGKLNS